MEYLVKSISLFTDRVKDRYFKRNESIIGFPLSWDKVNFRIRPQELSIWSGYGGHGKSAFLSQIAVQMAAIGEKTCIASFEMPADQTICRMVKQALGTDTAQEKDVDDCMKWLGEYVSIYDFVGRITSIKLMFDNFICAAETEGITHFQVDSMLKCGMNEDDYNGQKKLLEDLHNFAMKYYSHVHLVAHSRKGDDESKIPGKMDVAHAGAVTQLCNNGFTVWRNKKKEAAINESFVNRSVPGYDVMNLPDAIFECWKSREMGPEEEKRYQLWFNRGAIQYLEKQDDCTRSYFEAENGGLPL